MMNNINDITSTLMHESLHAWLQCELERSPVDCESSILFEMHAYKHSGVCKGTDPEIEKECIINKAVTSSLNNCNGTYPEVRSMAERAFKKIPDLPENWN